MSQQTKGAAVAPVRLQLFGLGDQRGPSVRIGFAVGFLAKITSLFQLAGGVVANSLAGLLAELGGDGDLRVDFIRHALPVEDRRDTCAGVARPGLGVACNTRDCRGSDR
ncbi:hypothetical protein D9M68_983370 [compost metagenome]